MIRNKLLPRGALLSGLCLAFAALANFSTPAGAQSLGDAETFAILGATTVTNTGLSHVSGNLGVSPGSAITGFPPGVISNGAIHANDGPASQAHAAAATAYTAFAGLTSPPANNLTDTDLGGMTLTPGVYRFNGAATSNGQLTFDAQGDAAARFVIQTGTTLVTSGTSSVVLINGANARNVFFQIGSSATLAAGSSFIGNILAFQSITGVSGAGINGRLFAINGAVTLDTNAVTIPLLMAAGGKADFNRDGYADLVLENRQTGERVIWFMEEGQFQSSISLGMVPTAWHIRGAADFNGDGYSDLIGENVNTGERIIWFLINGVYQSDYSLGIVPVAWRIGGAADFDADGYADVVSENVNTGERRIWFLVNGMFERSLSYGIVPTVWQIGGAADFNNDGHADVIGENISTGQRIIWILRNGVYQSGHSLGIVPVAWRISGAADFNADGHGDAIGENSQTGERKIWFLRDGGYESSAKVQRTTDTNWKVAVR